MVAVHTAIVYNATVWLKIWHGPQKPGSICLKWGPAQLGFASLSRAGPGWVAF